MKYIIFLTILFAVAFVPLVGNAVPEPVPDAFKLPAAGGAEGAPAKGVDLINRIQGVTSWVFAFFLAISLIYIILGAFQFVTGGDDPAQITAARQKLIYAAIGIAIALIAGGFPAVLRSIVI